MADPRRGSALDAGKGPVASTRRFFGWVLRPERLADPLGVEQARPRRRGFRDALRWLVLPEELPPAARATGEAARWTVSARWLFSAERLPREEAPGPKR
jgi:hypothetical protein